jgi:hypothetical protein
VQRPQKARDCCLGCGQLRYETLRNKWAKGRAGPTSETEPDGPSLPISYSGSDPVYVCAVYQIGLSIRDQPVNIDVNNKMSNEREIGAWWMLSR